MNDKELEQLFEAKRTSEANRRRQEELARMINVKAQRTRPLWPAWAGAVAAGIAVLLLTLPALFRTSNDTPMLASNTTFPQSEKPAHTISTPKLGEGDRPQGGGGVCQTTNKHTPPTTLRVATPSNLEGEPADAIEEPILIVEPEPMETEEPKEIINIAPRVHRRNSTLLACTDGCNIITVPENSQTQSTDLQQLLAEAFGSRNNEPLTLKTFELK
ncbi:MAG: hypothetical protein IK010_06120 [Bacteroidales bacterium]|nr:hypothetical protein [Bacteroidales bacterium]